MSEANETRAIGIIERAISDSREPSKTNPFAELKTLGQQIVESGAEDWWNEDPFKREDARLKHAVEAWLTSVRLVHREMRVRQEHVLWSLLVKPWLASIVGWSAGSDLGRAAGPDGYRMLAEEWQALWSQPQKEAAAEW